MKKHYKGLAVAMSAFMLAGGSFTAYAGPASETGAPSASAGNTGNAGFGPAPQPQDISSRPAQNSLQWRTPLFMWQ